MNKEVEEAKEYFEELIKGYEQNLKEIEDFDEYEEEQKFIKRRVSKLKILLNYIQELEELIHKERISAEAQTTYEVNKIWKEKIENKLEEVESVLDMCKDQKVAKYKIRMLEEEIIDLQELLNKEE